MDTVVAIFQILASAGTVGALIYLSKQTKVSTAATNHSRELMKLEMQRETRTRENSARVYAAGLVCWPVKRKIDCGSAYGVEIVNSSNACVYDIYINRPAGKTKGNQHPIGRLAARAAVLAPGRYFLEPGGFVQCLRPNDMTEPLVGNPDFMACIEFSDANGNRWTRDAQGMLKQVVLSA